MSTPRWQRASTGQPRSITTRSPRNLPARAPTADCCTCRSSTSTPSAAHIEHYARIVLEHASRRRYISAAQAELLEPRRDLQTVKQRAEALVLGAASDTLNRRAVLPPSQWTEHLMDFWARRGQADWLAPRRLARPGQMTLGLSQGLYLLAASTGTGKSALAGQIARMSPTPRGRSSLSPWS